jgi:hypothetical protein
MRLKPTLSRCCDLGPDLIPHQLFAVAIQAAIGGRIITRETIEARARTCSPNAMAATKRFLCQPTSPLLPRAGKVG